MAYKTGSIEPFWDTDFKNYEYTRQAITDAEINEWRTQGYDHKSFTGEMYGGALPMPDWVYKVADSVGLVNCGFTFYRMLTNDIMPLHVDHFAKYCEVFGVERHRVKRCALFLEDWQSGHYFEISNRAFVNWSAGEWILWDCDEPHFAANIGTTPRYTLQITGTYK